MVVAEQRALHAMHRLLHQGRWLASEGVSSQLLFAYFDELDGLMSYIVGWQLDMTVQFERELARVCALYQAEPVFEEYNRNKSC
jgi:hypothetical protein